MFQENLIRSSVADQSNRNLSGTHPVLNATLSQLLRHLTTILGTSDHDLSESLIFSRYWLPLIANLYCTFAWMTSKTVQKIKLMKFCSLLVIDNTVEDT